MTRGTTPTLVIHIKGEIDLNTFKALFVTIQQGEQKLTKKSTDPEMEVEAKKISLSLTQEETLRFLPGECRIQVRGVTKKGSAVATNIMKCNVKNILLKEVIT